jgi:glycosyltransferase involved in cell wall biosynthesis
MNILMVSDVYFPRINGVSTSIETFRRELVAAGDNVTLIAPRYGNDAPDENVIRVAARIVPFDPEDRMMSHGAVVRLADRLHGGAFDIVHIHTPFVAHYAGLTLARRLGVPCVVTYHTFFEEYLFHYVPMMPRTWLRAAARAFSRRQCNDVDAVIVPSTAMRDVLQAYGVTTRMQVLPTGIPRERFQRVNGAPFRARYDIAAQRPTALFVGRVAFEKNIDFLLRAIEHARRRMPDILLVIAGEGPALKALKDSVERRNLNHNVMFVGYLDRNGQLPECYCAADVFAFASLTETQGLVLLEAMTLGLPVVAIAAMGTRDILAESAGALVASATEQDFAAKLVRVLSDSPLRAALARQATEFAATWDAVGIAQRLRRFYAEMVTAGNSPSLSSGAAFEGS